MNKTLEIFNKPVLIVSTKKLDYWEIALNIDIQNVGNVPVYLKTNRNNKSGFRILPGVIFSTNLYKGNKLYCTSDTKSTIQLIATKILKG